MPYDCTGPAFRNRICKISFRKALCLHVNPEFCLHSLFQILISGGIQDFPDGGCQPLNLGRKPRFLPKVVWKWKKLDEEGALVHSTPLDPPMLIENFSFSTFVRKTMQYPILESTNVADPTPSPYPPPRPLAESRIPCAGRGGGCTNPRGPPFQNFDKTEKNIKQKN